MYCHRKEKEKQMNQDIQTLDRVLTSRGYAIRKSSLSDDEQKKIRKSLTVSPVVADKFAKQSVEFPVFYESPQRLYLPRQWALQNYGVPQANIIPQGDLLPPALKFKGNPFDYQQNIIQKFIDAGANGLICVPCGKGKTFMALAIAARLGRRFLVVVDKEFLLNQWKGEMETFFPGLRIGILQGPKCEIEPELYDCTICMIQSVVQKPYKEHIFHTYGFTIFDECHHLGAAHFSKVLMKIQTKWMLGLSATPKRDDGLTKVFEWFLGPAVYHEKTREPDETVSVLTLSCQYQDPDYDEEPVDWKGDIVMARLLGKIIDYKPRTERIADIIKVWIQEHPERRVLVLSERITHLEQFELYLKPLGVEMGYYIGGMKEAVRDKTAADARIVLATYAMASEAMNIKTLNAVVLASPRKKVEQSTGRILRVRPDQRNLEHRILDIIDSHKMYMGQWRKRLAYYKQCHYKIYQIGTDNTTRTEMIKSTDIKSKSNEIQFSGCAIADEEEEKEEEEDDT